MTREIKFRGFWIDTKKPVKDITDYGLQVLNDSEIAIHQFTGLLDNSNINIYEGDLIKDLEGHIYEIIMWVEEGCWAAKLVKMATESQYFDDIFGINQMIINEEEFNVIGNIYENHELIK